MRYLVPILLVLLFVSCKGIQYMENNNKKLPSIDGEYHIAQTRDQSPTLPYFHIVGDRYIFYQSGLGAPPPIKGTIAKLSDNCYLFNSEYQDPKLNYEKGKIKMSADSVGINIHFYSGSDILDVEWLAILKNGEVVPFVVQDEVSNPICWSYALANQIEYLYSRYYGSWKLSDYISEFEGGYHYNIVLMDVDYFVMKNEKIKIVGDTLIWQMESIGQAMYIK